ncbi:MAG: tRNA guanosine(34) transglycosylase Tgt [Oscillospiraceae bacterium]|jgi:queuine tRNA-ribosyltransferase|nr:tRNA guanosine(34) transglycosylase Tgt [Oscillospiraceae bacterium]
MNTAGFRLLREDGRARLGVLTTRHGAVHTPAFMNVATQAAIKGGLDAGDLRAAGCQIALSNTYHLHIRPGGGVVRALGGLHRFMAWDGPILTDSGGFQIFSLAGLRKITEEGALFSSHTDGRRIFISPEESIAIQADLGSDIAMAFDECIPIPSPYSYAEQSARRTYRWLVRCRDELRAQLERGDVLNPGQLLFGINQGAVFPDLRVEHMRRIAQLELPGYAIGGLAVGETVGEMYDTIELVEEHMPKDRPRYLMGVGTPANILESVARGIDMFDCVIPARNGRHGRLYTWDGVVNINNEKYKRDGRPIEEGCGCPACANYSRAYIRHLFRAGETLAMRLAVAHNLRFYNTLMERIRDAVSRGAFTAFRSEYADRLTRRRE